MSDQSANNKRIAKNTLLLYFRMLFIMGVNLYTTRIVINALGVEDYGIYNVVGSFVAMFTMLSGSLSSAISRFITFELGKNNAENLKKVFSSAVTIQIVLALIIILLAETVGLWFINTKIEISPERMNAANWVYQFSVLTFAVHLISIPFNASIIAHEKMSAFAYISILEVIGKLLVAFSIAITPLDKLIHYSLLLMLIAVVICTVFVTYCKRNFKECKYRFIFDKELLKQMFSFAGWNFIGASSAVLRDQGGNIIINLFCGATVNAARGIAIQVSHAVQGFATNFMTALNPQITKSYASGDHDYMMTLIFQGARLSFYILLILSLPVILNAHYILSLWLGIVPEHTVAFVQLTLIFAMSESLANPLITAMLATGNIRNYQLVVGGLQLLNLPLSYVFLRLNYAPECVFVIAIIVSVLCEMARLYMLRRMIQLSIKIFLSKVYFNVIIVSIIATILPYFITKSVDENFTNLIWTSLLCISCTIVSILYVGCTKKERVFVSKKLLMRIGKINKHKK